MNKISLFLSVLDCFGRSLRFYHLGFDRKAFFDGLMGGGVLI